MHTRLKTSTRSHTDARTHTPEPLGWPPTEGHRSPAAAPSSSFPDDTAPTASKNTLPRSRTRLSTGTSEAQTVSGSLPVETGQRFGSSAVTALPFPSSVHCPSLSPPVRLWAHAVRLWGRNKATGLVPFKHSWLGSRCTHSCTSPAHVQLLCHALLYSSAPVAPTLVQVLPLRLAEPEHD